MRPRVKTRRSGWRRLTVVATLVAIAAAVTVSNVVGRCTEPQAASSADNLVAAKAAPAVAPKKPKPATKPAEKSAVVPRSVFSHGVGVGGKVVAVAIQLPAVSGAPGGVDRAMITALESRHAAATFFMAGLWAQAHVDVAAQLGKVETFEIGNGGYSAEYFGRLTPALIRDRTQRAQDAISAATGIKPLVYRSAQTGYSARSIEVIASMGMRPVSGDVVVAPSKPQASATKVAEDAIARVRPGSIVVMSGDGSDPRMAQVLGKVVDGLSRKGYRLVTVSELIAR